MPIVYLLLVCLESETLLSGFTESNIMVPRNVQKEVKQSMLSMFDALYTYKLWFQKAKVPIGRFRDL